MFLIKIRPVSFKSFRLYDEGFANTFGAIRDCGRWSDIVDDTLPTIM